MLLGLYTRASAAWFSITSRLRDETGAVATEYALLLTLIAIAFVIAAAALGTAINDRLQNGADCVNAAPAC
jgi:Flp pilus assembly pilin Flp